MEEFSGESFRNDISSFVNSDIDELLWYRELVHCRSMWSKWAKRISRAVLSFMVFEGICTVVFFVRKAMDRPTQPYVLLSSIVVTVLAAGFCICCAVAMNQFYEKISEYRDKVL